MGAGRVPLKACLSISSFMLFLCVAWGDGINKALPAILEQQQQHCAEGIPGYNRPWNLLQTGHR